MISYLTKGCMHNVGLTKLGAAIRAALMIMMHRRQMVYAHRKSFDPAQSLATKTKHNVERPLTNSKPYNDQPLSRYTLNDCIFIGFALLGAAVSIFHAGQLGISAVDIVVLWKDGGSKTGLTPAIASSPSPKKPFRVRLMQLEDLVAVDKLGNSIFAEFPNLDRRWDDIAAVEYLLGSPAYSFVAVEQQPSEHERSNHPSDKEHIIGLLLGTTLSEKSRDELGVRGFVQWIGVKASHRRMGVATALFQQFAATAREQEDVSFILTDLPAECFSGIRFFQQMGLQYKIDHLYLHKQLQDVQLNHVSEQGLSNFTYAAKNMEITIRKMEANDLHSVFALGERLFNPESAVLYNFWDFELLLYSYITQPKLCVVATITADDDDDQKELVVGFAIGKTLTKPNSSLRFGHLVWLGCHPMYQRFGIGAQLYGVIAELFVEEKMSHIMIDTQQNNEVALRFFRKQGFRQEQDHIYLSNLPTIGADRRI